VLLDELDVHAAPSILAGRARVAAREPAAGVRLD
jgi:hypothetical protein